MDITKIVEAVIALIMVIVTTVLVPQLKKWLDGRNSTINWDNCVEIVRTLVYAAEQIYQSTTGEKLGEKRKEYVMSMLEKMNLKIDLDVLDAMVENEVLKLNETMMI